MNSDTLKIAAWEIMRNLRNKQYLISLLITPLIMVVFAGLPRLLEKLDKPKEMSFYVIDHANLLEPLKSIIPDESIKLLPHTGEDIEAEVYKSKAAGYMVIKADFLQEGKLEYHYNKRNFKQFGIIQAALTQLLRNERLGQMKVSPQELMYLTAGVEVEKLAMENAMAPKDNTVVVSIAFMVLIFFLIVPGGSMLMQSATQERRDRMAEIVLSSIKPAALMQGKILGYFALGVFQIIFWLLLSLPAIIYLLDFPVWQAIKESNIPLVMGFGFGGYLLFSTIYVSIGATMDDLQSAGNTQSMIIMIPMLFFLFIGPVVSNPEGSIAIFASIFPITSPFTMVLRSAFIKIPPGEIIISAIVLIISILCFVHLASKIFRVGMLMYGKTANFAEIVRWLRYKDKNVE